MNEWLNWVMGLLTLVAGCGWLFDRKRHRQEVESLRADRRTWICRRTTWSPSGKR